MQLLFEAFWYDEGGAALVEIALIIAVIAVGVLAVLYSLGQDVQNMFEMTSDHVEAAVAQEDPVEVAKKKGNRRWHSKNFPSPSPTP